MANRKKERIVTAEEAEMLLNAREQINIVVKARKKCKQIVSAHASSKGESVNGLVNALLRADMGLTEAEWKQAASDSLEE